MNKEELLFLGEIFRIYPNEKSYDLFKKAKLNTAEFVYLPEVDKEI